MNKKIIALVIAAIMFVSVFCFTACNSAEKSENSDKTQNETAEPESGKDIFDIEEMMGVKKAAFEEPETKVTFTQNPIATITMENGETIKIELYYADAPNTVCNFISLANKGFYDGLTFHRVIKDFMIQGGDPNGDGTGGPDYDIKGEFCSNGFYNNISHTRGTISMGRLSSGNDTAGSQFFICHEDRPDLDGLYAAFGKVIEGIAVVDEIANCETDTNDKPVNDVVIKSITVETFGVTYPEPEIIEEN